MRIIPLDPIPNQSLSLTLDNNVYDIVVKQTSTCISMSLSINGEVILSNQRIINGTPIIDYAYLQNGNFLLLTSNEELPDYTQFGVTQFLIYASQAELEAIANGS
jgi:hypothetical protein